jgi:hypothetical protein
MRSWAWLYVIAALAALFVAVSSVVQAVSEGSWAPVLSVGWMPAVIVAAWLGACRGRRGSAG